MKTATFAIGGMHCAACAARNERTLKKLAGVRNAIVNLATRSARVEFDDAILSETTIHHAVIGNGYEVLAAEFAGEHKERAREELAAAKSRARLALLLTIPVALLAMLGIELPWVAFGHNA